MCDVTNTLSAETLALDWFQPDEGHISLFIFFTRSQCLHVVGEKGMAVRRGNRSQCIWQDAMGLIIAIPRSVSVY